ncbi:E3 ubiquitin-protein ligase TTC3 [Neosynchiropus ocellatus]
MILTSSRTTCLPTRSTVQELFSVARDAGVIPDLSLDPVLTAFLSLDSADALQHQYDFLQRGMSSEQQSNFTQTLTRELGGHRVTRGGVGIVALALSLLLDHISRQVRGPSNRLASTRRPRPKKIFGIISSSRIGRIIQNYLDLIPSLANDEDKMAETTELFDTLLKLELIDHYDRMTTKKRMGTAALQQWQTGAAVHLHMRIHQVRLHSVPVGSAESLRLTYRTGYGHLVQRYTSYLRKTIKETPARRQLKHMPMSDSGPTRNTDSLRGLNITFSGEQRLNFSADHAAKMPRMQHITLATTRHCQEPDQAIPARRFLFLSTKEQEEYFDRWHRLDATLKQEAGHRWALTFYYLPILFNSAENVDPDSTLFDYLEGPKSRIDNLVDMDVTEALFRALATGTLTKEGTRFIFALASMYKDLGSSRPNLSEAMNFLEENEGAYVIILMKQLSPSEAFDVVNAVFSSYARFIIQMVENFHKTLNLVQFGLISSDAQGAEILREQGNASFRRHDYSAAVHFYSAAIRFDIQNHVIYGNRSLCYIRQAEYENAAIDGKRAILLKPDWAKGHYRYCEALFHWGHGTWAIQSNLLAANLCKHDPEGLKDLHSQLQKFGGDVDEVKALDWIWQSFPPPPDDFVSSLRPNPPRKPQKKNQPKSLQSKILAAKKEMDAQQAVKEKAASGGSSKDSAVKTPAPKKNSKSQTSEAAQVAALNKASLCKEMGSLVQAAQAALVDLRSRNAERSFSQALAMLDTTTPKKLGLSPLDVQLLIFGRASALTDIGQAEELAEARKLLEKSESFQEKTFQSLICYCFGRIYLKEKRFAAALKKFNDSLEMVSNNTTPGKLTWPLTKQDVRESDPNYLKEMLSDAMDLCKFPPPPDAVCQVEKRLCPLKAAIYFTDPDFKGFIQICCCQKCVIQYHTACWKTLKSSSFNDKVDKEFLHDPCFTPDCAGQICNIKIFDSTSQLKWEDGTTIPKPEKTKRAKVNQECTSLKKLKSKEERKLKRKQKAHLYEEKSTEEDEQSDQTAAQAPQKAVVVFKDGVLRQLSQKLPLLREEKALSVSTVTRGLKPWLELDLTRGSQLAHRLLHWQKEQIDSLGVVVEMILERKNRVWARVFVHILSGAEGVNPKLSSWASRLNDAGLNAARTFVERNMEHLEQLDLACPLTFGPFQEAFLQHLVLSSELLASTLTCYLQEAPANDVRLFIWTLDEHKDNYVSCHNILDDYFDMMEGHCAVLKKSTEKNSPTKTKSRARKKKRKEPKELIDWSDVPSNTPPEEWDPSFIESHTFPALDPDDPFSVPSYLRDQVYDFENQYHNRQSGADVQQILDRPPDTTEDYLYGYFAQVLEEHGPQVPDHPLLMDQLENFPEVAKMKIQEAGSLELFLLQSRRFIKIGDCIGLASQALAMHQATTVPPYDLYTYHDPSPYAFPVYLPYNTIQYYPVEAVKNHKEIQTSQENQKSVAVNTDPHHLESAHGDINKKEKGYWKIQQLLRKLSSHCEQADVEHQLDISSLEEEIKGIHSNMQVTNKELSLVQQKLEDEVKNDQKEKKSNQELLKSLKQEICELVEENKSLTRSIKDSNAKYEEKLSHFLDLSNQMESEKMSLEDDIKSCKASLVKARSRSRNAQISVVESYKALGLYGLHKQLAQFKVFLSKLDERSQRFPSPDLDVIRRSWRENIQEVEKKIAAAEKQYQEQIELVRSGENVSELIPVLKTIQSTWAAPMMSAPAPEFTPLPAAVDSVTLNPKPAAAEAPRKPARPLETAAATVFEKAMEELAIIFPDYTRADLIGFVRILRSSAGGNLSGMDLQEVIMRMTQLILDHQDNATSNTNREHRGPAPETPAPVWQKPKPSQLKAINLEDPCVICHEEMTSDSSRVLDCRHTFHVECISSWLKEQSTCPTCRGHTISPEEFPALASRRRQLP